MSLLRCCFVDEALQMCPSVLFRSPTLPLKSCCFRLFLSLRVVTLVLFHFLSHQFFHVLFL